MAATCRGCGRPIIWVQTPQGKWMPCDEGLVPYRQDSSGTDRVVTQNGEIISCRLEFEGKPTALARLPHWATCPERDRFKKGR